MGDLRLIIVEDDDNDAELVAAMLREEGFSLDWQRVDTAAKLAAALNEETPDLVISDYRLPGFSAEQALKTIQATGHDIPFILISGTIGEDAAVAMMHAGAHDYVRKEHMFRLVPAIRRELREAVGRHERRAAQEALRRSEQGFRLLAERLQDIIFRCQVEPVFELAYLSPAAAKLTGCPPEELAGDPHRFLGHVIDPHERTALERSWRTGQSTSLVVCWRRGDGVMAWFEQRAEGIYAEGRLVAVEGILRDVSERVLAQREHEMLIQQLQQAERLESLGLLAGGVAHDFNNALAVILSCARFLAEDLPEDAPSRQDVERIINAAQRSAALTSQLLVFARRQPDSGEVIDINRVLAGVEDMIRRTIGEDIEFSCSTVDSPAPVTLDRSKVEQVLINMVLNSRAAMPEGGLLRVETDLVEFATRSPRGSGSDGPQLPDGRYVRLRVSDTGMGMTPEVIRRAFDPFFTTKPPGEGTGLGLAMTYGVVRQAGGHVGIASQPGKGTVVTIHLPLAEASLAQPTYQCGRPEYGRGESVLVVEDDGAVREVVAAMLTRHGYTVIPAASATEALVRFAEPNEHIDLVLTDVVMPVMSGALLAEQLRRIRPQLPILYMSGYTAEHLPAVNGGRTEVIRKPFTQEHLLARLRKVLDTRVPETATPLE